MFCFRNNITVLYLGFLVTTLYSQEYSLKFLGSGSDESPDIDRVVIPLDNPAKPVDVGFDFTIEFWLKALPGQNTASSCNPNEWYFGNIVIDRDVFDAGDHGDYGIVICNRRIVAGVQKGNLAHGGVIGNTIVDDGQWHHIAITRQASSGGVWLYVDGVLDASDVSSPSTGDVSYRDGRQTSWEDDPTLVFGAEKHDYPGSLYFKGKLDEIRISNIIRYTTNFSPPTAPFIPDTNTFGLYHFNEGGGMIVLDSSGASGGPSHGNILYGGSPVGPQWSYDSPFNHVFEVTNTLDSGSGSLRQLVQDVPSGSTIVFAPHLQNQQIILQSPITIHQGITIQDLNNNQINIEINGQGPIFNILSTNEVVLHSLQLNAGNGLDGRAILNQGVLVLQNVQINDMNAGSGNSIFNLGTLDVRGLIIID